jgi:hypothetical protein
MIDVTFKALAAMVRGGVEQLYDGGKGYQS